MRKCTVNCICFSIWIDMPWHQTRPVFPTVVTLVETEIIEILLPFAKTKFLDGRHFNLNLSLMFKKEADLWNSIPFILFHMWKQHQMVWKLGKGATPHAPWLKSGSAPGSTPPLEKKAREKTQNICCSLLMLLWMLLPGLVAYQHNMRDRSQHQYRLLCRCIFPCGAEPQWAEWENLQCFPQKANTVFKQFVSRCGVFFHFFVWDPHLNLNFHKDTKKRTQAQAVCFHQKWHCTDTPWQHVNHDYDDGPKAANGRAKVTTRENPIDKQLLSVFKQRRAHTVTRAQFLWVHFQKPSRSQQNSNFLFHDLHNSDPETTAYLKKQIWIKWGRLSIAFVTSLPQLHSCSHNPKNMTSYIYNSKNVFAKIKLNWAPIFFAIVHVLRWHFCEKWHFEL